MTLATLIRKRGAGGAANDNPAKVANDGQARGEPLAGLAALSLASLPSPKIATALRHDKIGRLERWAGKIANDNHAKVANDLRLPFVRDPTV